MSAIPSTGYPIPKDVPSMAIVNPLDPNYNVWHSTNYLRTSWTTNKLPSTINLQQQIAHVFADSYQTTYFRILYLAEEPAHLSESIELKRNRKCSWPVSRNKPLSIFPPIHIISKNIWQRTVGIIDLMIEWWSRCLQGAEALRANTLIKFTNFYKFGHYFNAQIIKRVFKVNVPYSFVWSDYKLWSI